MTASELWDSAMEVDEYVRSMAINREVFAERIETTVLTDEQRFAFENDPIRILVLTEDFCGDSAQFIPPVARLSRESPDVDLRVLRRDERREFAASYVRKDGYQAIPVFIVLDRDGNERGYVIERPQVAYDDMAAETRRFAAAHPELEGANRTYDRMPAGTKAAVRENIERFRQERTVEWTTALFEELKQAATSSVPAT